MESKNDRQPATVKGPDPRSLWSLDQTATESDPDEDDLDDLDDMLDQFSIATDKPQPQAAESSATRAPSSQIAEESPLSSNEQISDELQRQMAALMGDVLNGNDFDSARTGSDSSKSQDPLAASDAGFRDNGEAFQHTIRKTMERIQTSSDQVQTAQNDGGEDVIAQMFKDLQGGQASNAGGDEGFDKMLLGMMEQLTNKEILYDPMKELHDNFPIWMIKNRATTRSEDLERYERQQRLVAEIVERFECEGYSDANSTDREYIVDRMQQMQAAGNPPSDLVGGTEATEAMADIESGCTQQ